MKKVLFVLALIAIVILTIYYKPRIFDRRFIPTISTQELITMLDSIKYSNTMQLNYGTILLKGNVTAIYNSALTLDEKIFCKFKQDVLNVNIGDSIVLTGNFIGYDDLFQELKMNDCSIVSP